jgi:hypothetical protein
MQSVMGIDNQDLLGKMEGFAVQGVKGASCRLFFFGINLIYFTIKPGAAQNHQKRVSQARAAIRNIINSTLRKSLPPFYMMYN